MIRQLPIDPPSSPRLPRRRAFLGQGPILHTMASLSTFGLAAPLLLGSSLAIAGTVTQEKPQEFRYERPVGKALGVTVKETHDLLLTSLTTQFGEAEPVASPVAMRLRTKLESALAEEVADIGPGPRAIRRRYLTHAGEIQIVDPASVDEAAGTWNGVGIDLKSPMEGASVAFVPADGQPDGYGRHFDTVALRETALPKLAVPTDWSSFLPPAAPDGSRQIALGDEWDLDIAALESVVAPAGFLGWRVEKAKDGEAQPESSQQILRSFASGVGGNLQLAFDGEVQGSAKAKLQTVGVDPDHGRYGMIVVEFDLLFSADREEFVDSRRLAEDGELDVEVLGGDLELTLKGVASVYWSLDSARPFNASVNAEEVVKMTVRVLPPNRNDIVTQSMSMTGTLLNALNLKEVPLSPAERTIVTDPK